MSSERIFNFSAGPAVLPVPVLERVNENILNYKDSGMGVMELSHRGVFFKEIIAQTERSLRELLSIGDDYAVLFVSGGASTQFAMVPQNFVGPEQSASYIVTGAWAKKALKEAQRMGNAEACASSEDKNFSYIPTTFDVAGNPAYVHFTSNNTIFGTQFQTEPDVGSAPLVCDASSDFLYRKIDVSKYSLIYAGAQKNIGPAGVTLIIAKRDFIEQSTALRNSLPLMSDYRTYIDSGSLFNTPPAFPIYVVGETLMWLQENGGLNCMEARNKEKAAVLYDAIDASSFYEAVAEKDSRSLMNVTFRLPSEDLDKKFVAEAGNQGFSGLGGHRSVKGVRASIYNAFPKSGVEALVQFMQEFEKSNG